MDAGDTPTFVLPISSAMTLMAWSGIEFEDGFTRANQMDELLDTLRWHADWCIAAHPEPNVFCGQIGQGGPSHAFWGPAEIHTQATGPAEDLVADPGEPGVRVAGEAAAFLAAASMLFEKSDAAYAATLLQHARELFAFAATTREPTRTRFPESVPSTTRSRDTRTNSLVRPGCIGRPGKTYLDSARQFFDEASPDPYWSQSWDGKINGAACLLAALTGESSLRRVIETNLNHWQPGGGITYTLGGLAWLDQWGSLRYATRRSSPSRMRRWWVTPTAGIASSGRAR